MTSGGRLKLGFIALNDAAPLIVADALGYFAEEGLDVEVVHEVSWATVRDKVEVGALDGAHMLAPMALATSIGAADAEPTPLIATLALNLNGPAVTLSSRLAAVVGPDGSAAGLARLVGRRREEGASPITLAVVFPFSTHNYFLRDWLARAGIDPDRDVRLMVAPPARMTGLLVDGVAEGICVTEPWGAAAVAAGAGVVAARSERFWPRTPDKVFAVTEAWARENPERLQALLRAMIRAAAWCDAPQNRPALAEILARSDYVGADREVIARSLGGMVFHDADAGAPLPVHAGWLLAQMMRWGHVAADLDIARVAARVYRPDLYAQAAMSLRLAIGPLPVTLAGYGAGGVFRLETARAEAIASPLSRMRPT
jgi:NitT/TauT family transport system ATP-binding protein/nitrate/nitrite transport system substrate-binding protein